MAKRKTKTEDEIIDSVYINPLTDFGFKRLFLNRELLIAFLNDVAGTDIKDIQYQPTEGLGEYRDERTVIFDLLCTTGRDEYIIVEMQLGQQTFFRDRVVFYASHVIRKQAPRKKYWDYNLKAVFIVSILDFIIFPDEASKNEIIERVYLYRERAKTLFTTKLNMIFVELKKFTKTVSELQDNMDTWLYLLKHAADLKSCPPEITGRVFRQFLETAEIKKLTQTDMETYKRSLKQNFYVRDIANCARMEGRMEGRMEERMNYSRQIAIKLLMMNEPVEKVIDLTELSAEQVHELLKQLPES
jgi:predicted transposase/invertase (TIGR01784 family)